MRIDKMDLISPREAIKLHTLFQDFMILLTGVERSVEWPTIGVYRKKCKAKIYYWRGSHNKFTPTRSDLWICLPEVNHSIGKLFDNWCRMRENYGPGVYLYLATRRGKELYNEHSFISLVWGLESLHRLSYPQVENIPLKEKIRRISEGISDKNDKKWFLRQSEYKAEPRLADRLFHILGDLNIGIDVSQMRSFLEDCASARNDISHFGGERDPGNKKYDAEFLITARYVLGYLYHALLLKKMGIDEKIIINTIISGSQGYKFKHWLKRVGLNISAQSALNEQPI